VLFVHIWIIYHDKTAHHDAVEAFHVNVGVVSVVSPEKLTKLGAVGPSLS
jgi:hypothetical protein